MSTLEITIAISITVMLIAMALRIYIVAHKKSYNNFVIHKVEPIIVDESQDEIRKWADSFYENK